MLKFYIIMVFIFLKLFVFADVVSADCTVTPGPDFCFDQNGNTICEPTWQYDCGGTVLYNQCPPNQHLTNNGCVDNGAGGACDCGVNAQGACKSCGGSQCNADYLGSAGCDGPVTPIINGSQCINNNSACKDGSNNVAVGPGQSLGGCCSEDADGNCKATTVYNHQCCPAGTSSMTCSYVDDWWTGQATYPHSLCFDVGNGGCTDQACRDQWWCPNDPLNGNTYTFDHLNWYPTDYHDVSTRCYRDDSGWVFGSFTATCVGKKQVCTCNSCTNTAASGVTAVQGASATTADVSWTTGTGGASQRLYVDQSQTEVNNGCPTPNACEVNATLASGTNSYIVTGLAPATTYYFRVTNYQSDSCNLGTVSSYTTPDVSLSGRVYLDTDNNCSTATPWNLGGLTVTEQGTAYSGSVGSDGRFGFFGGSTTPVNLVLSGFGTSYIPSTAVGCNSGSTLTSVANPSTTNYFYLTPSREAWWQAVGGSVYSAGNVRSTLPFASSTLIAAGEGGAIGTLMRATGTVTTGSGTVSTPGYSAQSKYRGKTLNYDFFAAQMGVTTSTANDWAVNTLSKPANNPSKTFYYIAPTSGEASVSTPWVIAPGESYVIFVNGDLRIASTITVQEGGFLAFIVNGSMRVSPAVTTVQGIYDVDGSVITESNGATDVSANFEGSVVTWGGVTLGRDLHDGNTSDPAESFRFRPDLINNMPDAMKVFALRWQEVVPGTFGQ